MHVINTTQQVTTDAGVKHLVSASI